MMKNTTSIAAAVAGIIAVVGCVDADVPANDTAAPAAGADALFGTANDDAVLPTDQVFFPEADAEGDRLFFRIQMLPGYYVYKDHIDLRVLTDGLTVSNLEYLSPSSTVNDDWFGEQEVFYLEASASAALEISDEELRSAEVELSYRGCKEQEICYLPVSKVITVALPPR